jgi:hypothetical protein
MPKPTDETWRPIPGYDDDYEVSDQGRIRSWRHRTGRREVPVIRALILLPNGSLYVSLQGPPARQFTVHRLVMLAFVGPRPDGMDICHGNGDKTDNRLSNLRYDTHLNNALEASRHGVLSHNGSRSKLIGTDVRRIRTAAASGVSLRSLAQDFGVAEATIAAMVHRRTWKHVD